MLIIEIALGIVLAVLILRFLPAVVAGALILGILAVALFVVILVLLNLEKVAPFVGAIAAVAALYGIPFWLKDRIAKKYPTFEGLIKGSAPYDRLSKQPLRLTVMASFAVAVALAGIGSLLSTLYFVELITKAFAK